MSHQGHTTKDHDQSPDVQAIAKLVRTIHELTDAEALAAHYTEDAVRIAPFAPGLYHGAAAIRADFELRFAAVASRKLEDIDLEIVTNGNYAVAHSQQRIATTGKDGTVARTTLRSHDVFLKDGDGWKIVVQHTSYFGDMAKMAAVTDYDFIRPGTVHWDEAPFPEAPIDVEQAQAELKEWQIDDIHAQVAEQAMHYYGPGDYTTVYDSRTPPGRMVGMWDVFQGWAAQMILKHVDDTLAEYRCWTDGQFAAIYTIQDIVATKLDGTRLVEQIRQTDCLHRVDGHWYSFVESVSWPFEEATGKLVLNLPQADRA